MSLWTRHQVFEKNSIILIVGILLVIAIGGLVEITPLFYLKSTIEVVDGIRPYTPLELTGRNIYVREGCYLCHSQMIRPLRDEVDRYGHFSLAAESMFDHPFQWGSKRTGPDLARVGAKYSDDWHVTHLTNPRAIVPQSVMPGYPFLAQTEVDPDTIADHMRTLRTVGVPYTDDQIANAGADMRAQADPDNARTDAFSKRYAKAGHGWDGIKELNTPLPRWWVISFYLTIIWSIGYWIVYPAWPLISSHTTGLLGYSTRASLAVELANLEALRGEKMAALAAAPLADIEKDPALLALARAKGRTVFGDNCGPWNGSGGAGAKSFPNLNDDDWLWGGTLDQIMQTIQFGARSGHAKTHEDQMLAFGKDGVLKKDRS